MMPILAQIFAISHIFLCLNGQTASDFLFLTLHNGTNGAYDVNLVTESVNASSLILLSQSGDQNGTSGNGPLVRSPFRAQFRMLASSDPANAGSGNALLPTPSLNMWTATTQNVSTHSDGTVVYQVPGVTDGQLSTAPLHFPPASTAENISTSSNGSSSSLSVCVFGDFSENLYEHSSLDISALIDDEKCNLTLFIGKIAWERRLKPKPAFNFSPYVMLHSATRPHKNSAFARVPAIFGAADGGLSETTYFQSSEVGDVAFLQITVEIATVANLSDGTLAYEMIAQYFRETMLNELECKLQELHRRERRPWIVLYMTHPYLVSNDDNEVQWIIMNDTDRFFDILKRYKVDLLTSCGIEGMARIIAAKRAEMPDAKLPEYIQTTMAQCAGYLSMDVTLQNECSYAVLDIRTDRMLYRKRNADTGSALGDGQIERTFEKADQCMPDEL